MFGRRRTDARTLVSEFVLAVDQAALHAKSPDVFGTAAYHVRVFRPSVDRPVVLVGDLGNHHAASVTNRFDEVGALVSAVAFDIPEVRPVELHAVARWIEYYPENAHGAGFLESFNEVWFEPSGHWAYPSLRSNHLQRPAVEEAVGGPVRHWRAGQYTRQRLALRGTRVHRVTG